MTDAERAGRERVRFQAVACFEGGERNREIAAACGSRSGRWNVGGARKATKCAAWLRQPRSSGPCALSGNPVRGYAGDTSARRRYPSDLSDALWALVEPLFTSWREEKVRRGLTIGHPPRHDLRDLLDAVLYVALIGIPWRYLPHDYPHWNTVYHYFGHWEKDGIFEQLNALLRRRVREDEAACRSRPPA